MRQSPLRKREIGVSVDNYVFERVPDYRRAVITGVKTHDADTDLIERGLLAANRKWHTQRTPTAAFLSVQRWRKAYRRVGLNPTRTRPAVEALIRRARAGDVLSFGEACIDVGAIVTLQHILPVGMHAIDDLEGDLVLSPANGAETFATFTGAVEYPEPGEVIWHADDVVLTRHWVHRQGIAGSVTDESLLFAVNLDVIADDDLDSAIESMAGWLQVAGVSVTCTTVLDHDNPADTVST
ncbi:MAG: phenylalanine--tRNA ligase beta subunit-related protein [Solirubrobacteraceae bacterium]|jgi:DNA/RNA-binding domain of Phe-tRNA-synthetase-like protein